MLHPFVLAHKPRHLCDRLRSVAARVCNLFHSSGFVHGRVELAITQERVLDEQSSGHVSQRAQQPKSVDEKASALLASPRVQLMLNAT